MNDDPKAMDDLLETNSLKDHHVAYGNKGSKNELRNLSPRILEKIAILTRTDVKLYKIALEQLIKEILWVESQLKRRILCDDVLAKKEPELTYLGLNVTQLYKNPSAVPND